MSAHIHALDGYRAVDSPIHPLDDQLFSPTVFDDVTFGPLYGGLPEHEVRRRAAWALASKAFFRGINHGR